MLRILVFLIYLAGCNQPANQNPHLLIRTNLGEIEIELYPEKAPLTVKNFLSYVDSGYYDDGSFYRVLKTDDGGAINPGIIQGGIWETNPQLKSSLKGIVHESTRKSGLTHTEGMVSLARIDTGTANSEFFICIGDQSPLDAGRRGTKDSLGMAAFGSVIKGMSVVKKIQSQPSNGDRFSEKITMSIKRK